MTDRYEDTLCSSGILSQLNLGKPNIQIAEHFICLAPCTNSEAKYAEFGKVVQGMDIVQKAGAWGSASDQPLDKVVIADCGEVAAESGVPVSSDATVAAPKAANPSEPP